MIQASQARSVGRKMMRENKGILLGTYFAYTGITVVLSMLSVLFSGNYALTMLWSIGITFVTVPLMLGVLHVYNMVYYKRSCSVSNLFDFFSNYRVSIKVIGVSYICSMMIFAVMVPLAFVIILPAIGFASYSGDFLSMASSMVGSMVMLLIVAVLVGMLVSSLIMASYYIALRNRSIAFGKLLSDSIKIGGKYIFKYFVFQLSFIGWALLSSIPAIIVIFIETAVLVSSPTAAYSMIYGGRNYMLLMMMIPMILTMVVGAFLQVYILSSSAAFWNTAIDEYEQKHPEYAGYTPNIPQPPAGNFAPEQNRFQDFRVEEPPRTDDSADDLGAAPRGEQQALSTDDAGKDGPIEHVEAEQIIPGDDAQKNVYDVVLIGAGVTRMTVGRIISEVTPFGPAEAQALIDSAPVTIREGLSREEAHEIAKLLTDAGALVEIR